jgi:hypothetical protein
MANEETRYASRESKTVRGINGGDVQHQNYGAGDNSNACCMGETFKQLVGGQFTIGPATKRKLRRLRSPV